mmetsp:Transcript_8393/g.20875  ORF Transcript_8393/g.20875 Transcript_8393/m.20875 type:complete len:392 (+) Transcript_8393:250-1425(+)
MISWSPIVITLSTRLLKVVNPSSSTTALGFLRLCLEVSSWSSRSTRSSLPLPCFGSGSVYLVPRVLKFLIPLLYVILPSACTNLLTRIIVALPHDGQKFSDVSVAILKHAWHLSTNCFTVLTTRPSRSTTRSPICMSTFCIAKSVVAHAIRVSPCSLSLASSAGSDLTLSGVIQPSSSSSPSYHPGRLTVCFFLAACEGVMEPALEAASERSGSVGRVGIDQLPSSSCSGTRSNSLGSMYSSPFPSSWSAPPSPSPVSSLSSSMTGARTAGGGLGLSLRCAVPLNCFSSWYVRAMTLRSTADRRGWSPVSLEKFVTNFRASGSTSRTVSSVVSVSSTCRALLSLTSERTSLIVQKASPRDSRRRPLMMAPESSTTFLRSFFAASATAAEGS